jgi:hypothetical protein
MIKEYHVIAAHFVNNFLSAVAARVAYVHDQFNLVFSPACILFMILQIRQYKVNDVVLSERFTRTMSIDAYRPLTLRKTVIITFEVPIVFLTGGTSTREYGYMELSWYI